MVVNRGEESRPRDGGKEGRDLNAVEGYDAAFKLAQVSPAAPPFSFNIEGYKVNLEEMIKNNVAKTSTQKQSSVQTPTTYSHVYLRVQPYLSTLGDGVARDDERSNSSILQFLLLLSDPEHKLSQVSITQAIPKHWLQIWDQYDWVEDLVADSLRVGVEFLGQEYLVARMGWASKEDNTSEVKHEDSDVDMVVVDSKAN